MLVHKYDALGNDFLLVPGSLPDAAGARALCDRRRGVGADGVLSVAGDRVHLRNADGSAAGFSGNGLRCAALHRVLQEGAPPTLSLEMGERRHTVEVLGEGPGREVWATLEAPARTLRAATATDLPAGGIPEGAEAWIVDVGNPHLVLLADDAPAPGPEALEGLRRGIPAAPGGINVTWFRIQGPGRAAARTHERGVGPTLACASGTLAGVLAARSAGRLGDAVVVALPGGTLRFEAPSGDGALVRFGGPVHLRFEARGPATEVSGTVLRGR